VPSTSAIQSILINSRIVFVQMTEAKQLTEEMVKEALGRVIQAHIDSKDSKVGPLLPRSSEYLASLTAIVRGRGRNDDRDVIAPYLTPVRDILRKWLAATDAPDVMATVVGVT
jgi:hypothetical protein